MAVTDLVAAIRAAIDETEQVAKSASGWSADGRTWRRDLISCVEDGDGRLIVYGEGTPTSAEADHIARHDPAAVLRRCAADRKILDPHVPFVMYREWAPDPADRVPHMGCFACWTDYDPKGEEFGCTHSAHDWPCATVLALAEAYGVEDASADTPGDKTRPEIA